MLRFNSDYWALILGGSSGFGLATAKKLSRHGMNICIVHRDRRGAMKRLEMEYQEIRDTGVQVLTYNVNALSPEGVQETLDGLQGGMGADGRVRMLLHSIAYGNLKLLSQEHPEIDANHERLLNKLSQELGISKDSLQSTFDKLFDQGEENLLGVASPAKYNNDELLQDEDFALTIYSMGSSLVTWVHEVFKRRMFAADARVLGMTSEGNEVAWKGYAAVSAAKVVLESIARSIAVEYAPYGIRANIIQAGVTDTPALRLIPGNSHLKATAKLCNPYKRMTTPEDVANFIYLMCLDEAAWANGNIIRVDGGEHISG
ncbi:MAG: SDR family oxidoreductase [Caldithrix sp.]|nr:MAG: SDR family oxidoreductase [Caldithrix sp.]